MQRPFCSYTYHDPEGPNLTTSQSDITDILAKFYASMYSAEPTDAAAATSWLDQVDLPTIDGSLLSSLNAPISLEEITQLPKGKAPGPDRFTSDFYKLLVNTLALTFLSVYQHIFEGHPYLLTGLQAHIKLIPKKGKDPTDLDRTTLSLY